MIPFVVFILIGSVFVGLLMFAIQFAIQRGKPYYADPETGTLVFRYNAVVRGCALFFAFGVAVGFIVLWFFDNPNNRDVWAFIAARAVFALMGAYFLWETMRFALTVSFEGLDCRSPWRGRRFIAWDEVEEVSFSKRNSWFIIHAADGWRFRVPLLVLGLSEFLLRCELHLPLECLARAKPGYFLVGRPFPVSGLSFLESEKEKRQRGAR